MNSLPATSNQIPYHSGDPSSRLIGEKELSDPRILFEQEDYRKALELIEESLIKDPENLEDIELKANCLFKLGQFKEAIQGFEKILQGKGAYIGRPERVFNLVECTLHLSQYEKAFGLIENYYSFNPTCKKFLDWLKTFLIPKFSKQIDNKKINFNLIALRAFAYALAYKFKECHQDLHLLFSKNPSHPMGIKIFLKQDLMSNGAFFNSKFKFELNSDHIIDDDKLLKLLLNYNFNLKYFDEFYNFSISNDPMLLIFKAAVDFKQNRIKKGVENIIKSYSCSFDDADIYSQRGIILSFLAPKNQNLHLPSPLEDFQRALDLNPNHLLTKKALIFHFLTESRYEEALKYLSDLEEYYLQVEEEIHPYLFPEEKKFKEETERFKIEALLSVSHPFEMKMKKYMLFLFQHFKNHPFRIDFRECSSLGFGNLKHEIEMFIEKAKKNTLSLDCQPYMTRSVDITTVQKEENFSEKFEKTQAKIGYLNSELVFRLANSYLNLSEYERLFDCLENYQSFHPTSRKLQEWVKTHLIPKLTKQIEKDQNSNLIAWRAFAFALAFDFADSSQDLSKILSKNPSHPLGINIFMKRVIMMQESDRDNSPAIKEYTVDIKHDYQSEKLGANILFRMKKYDKLDHILGSLSYPHCFLLLRAFSDFKKDNTEGALSKIIESFLYHFDDPDIYCQRGILLSYFVPENYRLPSPLDDFQKALRLNPNHLLTKKAMLFHLLTQGDYKKALNYIDDLEKFQELVEARASPKKKKEKQNSSIEDLLSSYQDKSLVTRIKLFASILASYFKEKTFLLTSLDESTLNLKPLKTLLQQFLEEGNSKICSSDSEAIPLISIALTNRFERKLNKKSIYLNDPKKIFNIANFYLKWSKYKELFECLDKYQSFHPACKQLRNWIKNHLIPEISKEIESKKGKLDLIAWGAFAYFLSGQFVKCEQALRAVFSKEPNHRIATIVFIRKVIFFKSFVGDISGSSINGEYSEDHVISIPYKETDSKLEKMIIDYHFLVGEPGSGDQINSIYYNSSNAKNYLIVLAIIDFRNNNIEDGIKKIEASFKYEFDDPDIYSKRGILLSFFVPEKNDFPPPIEDFKRALELNPQHVLARRALLYHFLKERQYSDALECLLFLEKFYSLLEGDILPHISSKEKKFSKGFKREIHKSVRFIRQCPDFESFLSSYVSHFSDHLKSQPFTTNFQEWSNISLEVLKTRLIEKECKTTPIKISPSVSSTSNFSSNLIKKIPSIIQSQIKEIGELIFVELILNDREIGKILMKVCREYSIRISKEGENHFICTLNKDEISLGKSNSFFKLLQKSIDAIKVPKSETHPQPLPKQEISEAERPAKKKIQEVKRKKPKKTDLVLAKLEAKRESRAKRLENKKKELEKKKSEKDVKKTEKSQGSLKKPKPLKEYASIPKKPERVNPTPSLPLEGGTPYKKPKETPSKTLVKGPVSFIKPVNAVIPEFSELQLKNLECATLNLMALEDSVKDYFGKNNPQISSLKAPKKLVKREIEYLLLRAFEAIDPTCTNHPLREDPEYCTKIALTLGNLEDIRNIRNYIRSFYFKISSKWLFKFAIEFTKRCPSKTLKNLIESQSSFVITPLTITLRKISSTSLFKKGSFPSSDRSEKTDAYFLSLMTKEFKILETLVKPEESFSSFSLHNTNLPIIKKCLSNIQKCSTFLSEEKFKELLESPKFCKIREMGACIAHDIPDPLPIGIEDEVSCSDIYSLLFKDPQFFEEMLHLIKKDYAESLQT